MNVPSRIALSFAALALAAPGWRGKGFDETPSRTTHMECARADNPTG